MTGLWLSAALLSLSPGCLDVTPPSPDPTGADMEPPEASISDGSVADRALPDADMGEPPGPAPCGPSWPAPEAALEGARPGPDAPIGQLVTADLNCDGYDDVLLPVPTLADNAGTVEVLYGGPWPLGARGGALPLPLFDGEQPQRVLLHDFDAERPGVEIALLVRDVDAPVRWLVVGFQHTEGGAFERVTSLDITPFIDTDVDIRDLHLAAGDLDGIPPDDLIAGTEYSLVPLMGVDWSRGADALLLAQRAPNVPLLMVEELLMEVYRVLLYPQPSATSVLMTVGPSIVGVYGYGEGGFFDTKALSFDPQTTVSHGVLADLEGDGASEVLLAGPQQAGGLQALKPTLSEDAEPQLRGFSMPLDRLGETTADGRFDGLIAGQLHGLPRPEVIILDRQAIVDPNVQDPNTEVLLFVIQDPLPIPPMGQEVDGTIGDNGLERVTLTRGVEYLFMGMGRFTRRDGDAEQLVVMSPSGELICLEAGRPEGGALVPCAVGE